MIPGVPGRVATVAVAEKGCVRAELIVRGHGGHSSSPPLPPTLVCVFALPTSEVLHLSLRWMVRSEEEQ